MSVTVRIPTPLRPVVSGQAEVKMEGATVVKCCARWMPSSGIWRTRSGRRPEKHQAVH
jgi:hypothetical protein